MALIVQKYGGTSVGTTERIKVVAERVKKARANGDDVVVVLSAMSGQTTKLLGLAKEVGGTHRGREMDVLLSSGEQVSIALLAMALEDIGCKAKSFLGYQVPITTNSSFGAARIESIDTSAIDAVLKEGLVAVVAGFQGVDSDGNITTLGRGGSDTTAVAIASALKADLCEIYTDVEGIFTTDPGVCEDARKLTKISYEEMLEMSSLGAKVLQTRSVEFANKYNVTLMVRSSFTDTDGTLVTKEDSDMESVVVAGITYNKDEAKISVLRVPDKPGIAVKLFKPLTEADINVDMIVQNISHDAHTDMTFTVTKADFDRAMEIVRSSAKELEASKVIGNSDIAKVSIVGAGMRSHAGIASKMFEVLSENDINIQMISTSEIKVSCVIDEARTEEAVRALHAAFELGTQEAKEEVL